jgi:galactose mutarotase-like enzyme
MITSHSDQYTAVINPLGAELTHLTTATGRELLWQAPEGKFWRRHAPILFPAIGKSNADRYQWQGQEYEMGQHGFARDYPFTVVQQADDVVVLRLVANADTRLRYPFAFELTVTYWLSAEGLQITYHVFNAGAEMMPFALGFHPGFQLSAPLETYLLEFEGGHAPIAQLGVGPAPFRDGRISPLLAAQANLLPLSHQSLDAGLVILDARDMTAVTLREQAGRQVLRLSIKDFPYVTLWTPEHQQAPFICLEPFAGLPDQKGPVTDWRYKLGNQLLPAGESHEFKTMITE